MSISTSDVQADSPQIRRARPSLLIALLLPALLLILLLGPGFSGGVQSQSSASRTGSPLEHLALSPGPHITLTAAGLDPAVLTTLVGFAGIFIVGGGYVYLIYEVD